VLLTILAGYAVADQPIMNEVPRWAGGYGAQVFIEQRWSDNLLSGSRTLDNPSNLYERKQLTHLEAVYTFKPWIRVTGKMPYIRQWQRVADPEGGTYTKRNDGIGDLTLALPIRKYTNGWGYSGHFGIVPQIRLPLGNDSGDYPISDGTTDYGFSMTFERETPVYIISIDTTYWWEQGRSTDETWSIDFGLGWNFSDHGSFRWETELERKRGGDKWLATGPALLWNFNDIVLARIEYKNAIYERVSGIGFTRGNILRVGIGVVY